MTDVVAHLLNALAVAIIILTFLTVWVVVKVVRRKYVGGDSLSDDAEGRIMSRLDQLERRLPQDT